MKAENDSKDSTQNPSTNEYVKVDCIWSDDMDKDIIPMIRRFLNKNGCKDVPLPPRLWMDYLRPDSNSQGTYVWYPITINHSSYQENGVDVRIYNKNFENHESSWALASSSNEYIKNKCDEQVRVQEELEQINLEFDEENFPQITSRYSNERIKDDLIRMCEAQGLPLTEINLYSCAANLESDLEHMFP